MLKLILNLSLLSGVLLADGPTPDPAVCENWTSSNVFCETGTKNKIFVKVVEHEQIDSKSYAVCLYQGYSELMPAEPTAVRYANGYSNSDYETRLKWGAYGSTLYVNHQTRKGSLYWANELVTLRCW